MPYLKVKYSAIHYYSGEEYFAKNTIISSLRNLVLGSARAGGVPSWARARASGDVVVVLVPEGRALVVVLHAWGGPSEEDDASLQSCCGIL